MRRKTLLILIFLGISSAILGQKVTVKAKRTPIFKVIKKLEKEQNIPFLFKKGLAEIDQKISVSIENKDIKEALKLIFSGTKLRFKKIGKHWAIKSENEIPESERKDWISPKKEIFEKKSYQISGYVRDSSSQEELIGAVIYDQTSGHGIGTNEYGFFSLQLSEGKHQLKISYVGFEPKLVEVNLKKDVDLNLHLNTKTEILQPIIVTPKTLFFDEQDNGKLNLSDQDRKINGGVTNSDILEIAKNEMGIGFRSEGSGGINVRGGGTDQNLFILDEAPIYNESHFLGLVSIFNSNAIKKATLYKNGIPARYGSRLSSVMDIKMREGNLKRFSFSGSVNPYTADLLFEGPIVKDKASILVSGRSSLIGYYLKKPLKENFNIGQYLFFDLTAKINFKIGKKDRFFLSTYVGGDRIMRDFDDDEFDEQELWGNITATFRWNHVFGSKMFSNLSVTYSHYNFGQEFQGNDIEYSLYGNTRSINGKYELTIFANKKNTIQTGIQFNVTGYEPENSKTLFFGEASNSENAQTFTAKFNKTLETAFYIENVYKPIKELSLSLGLRLSGFNNFGNGKNLSQKDEFIIEEPKSGMYNLNGGIEPRVNILYQPYKSGIFQLSYDRMMQYIFLASNSIARNSTDIWIPVTNNLKPANMHQISLGYRHWFKQKEYELSSNIYYKRINNVVDFKNNAFVFYNELTEFYLEQGIEDAYGLELSFRRQLGNLRFGLQYHYGFAEYRFENINQGKQYFAPHDKRHTFRANINYNLKNSWIFGLNFQVSNGARTNYPIALYEVEGATNILYNERNADQLPVYHRLDLFITWKIKPRKRWNSELTLSVYNVYNQKNPYSYRFEPNSKNVRMNYLMPIIPSITYKFRF